MDYIRPATAHPKAKQKKLMQAVGKETRLSKGPESTMIQENKELFDKVSRQNLKRADQLRCQFSEQRIFMYDKLNSKHIENKIKLTNFTSRNPLNSDDIVRENSP